MMKILKLVICIEISLSIVISTTTEANQNKKNNLKEYGEGLREIQIQKVEQSTQQKSQFTLRNLVSQSNLKYEQPQVQISAPNTTQSNTINLSQNNLTQIKNRYTGDSDPNTTANVAYCLTYNKTACIECAQFYVLSVDGMSCTVVNNTCKQLNSNNSSCLICFGSRIPSGMNCIDPKCNTTQKNDCSTCLLGYYIDSNYNCVTIPVLYCIQFVNTTCTQCVVGYRLTKRNKCRPLPVNSEPDSIWVSPNMIDSQYTTRRPHQRSFAESIQALAIMLTILCLINV